MRYALEPLDLALFRDGRPFSADDFNRARSLSMVPMPRTVYGALRAAILAHNRITPELFDNEADDLSGLRSILGTASRVGGLRLKWICAGLQEQDGAVQALLPAPADSARIRLPDGKSFEAAALLPLRGGSIGRSNMPDGLQTLYPHRYDNDESGNVVCTLCDEDTQVQTAPDDQFLDQAKCSDYLRSRAVLRPAGDLIKQESRIGIEMNNVSRRPESGMFYMADMLRPDFAKRVCYVCEIDVENGSTPIEQVLPDRTICSVGGERRPFELRRLPSVALADPVNIAQIIASHQGPNSELLFRLYLVTPGCFQNGWKPLLAHPEFEIELVAAACPRPAAVSGWNLATNKPRPAKLAVPAGSVYFCKATPKPGSSAGPTELVDHFWLRSLQHPDEDEHAMGFATALVGGFQYV